MICKVTFPRLAPVIQCNVAAVSFTSNTVLTTRESNSINQSIVTTLQRSTRSNETMSGSKSFVKKMPNSKKTTIQFFEQISEDSVHS